jgi:hypothetical protein
VRTLVLAMVTTCALLLLPARAWAQTLGQVFDRVNPSVGAWRAPA